MNKNSQSSSNLHADDALFQERELRKMRIIHVQEGQKSAYWKILREKVEQWIAQADKRRLDLIENGVTADNLHLLNDEKIMIKAFGMVLKINESVIYENKTWLERVKGPLKQAFEYISAFVGYGRKPENEKDGQS